MNPRTQRRLAKRHAEALLEAMDGDELADVVAASLWWLLSHDDAFANLTEVLAAAGLNECIASNRQELEDLAVELSESRVIPV